MTVVRQAELAVSPWKNGKGRKADVAEGDGWFVGLAWLEADVAFSNFPRTDRTTVLVDGAGFTLHFYGRGPCTFAVPGDRHGYAGDLPAQVKLVDGTCTVFNVMTRRGDLTHTVEVTDTLPDNGFAVVLRGSVEADGGPAGPGDVLVLPHAGAGSADLLVAVAVVTPAG